MIPDYTPVNLTDEADSLMAELIGQALAILGGAGSKPPESAPTQWDAAATLVLK